MTSRSWPASPTAPTRPPRLGARCRFGRHGKRLFPSTPIPVGKVPRDNPAVTPESRAALEPLPTALGTLRRVLTVQILPDTGGWVTTALAVLRPGDDPLSLGRLLQLLGRWHVNQRGNFPRAAELFRGARDALLAASAAEEACQAASYAALAAHAASGSSAALAECEERMVLARRPDVSPLARACAAHDLACTLASSATDELPWRRAQELFEATLRDCPRADEPSLLVHSALLVSLAVCRHLDGKSSPSPGLARALARLRAIAVADPFECWRIDALGSFLGAAATASPKLPAPLDDDHRRRLLLSVEPWGVLRRQMKLLELFGYVFGVLWGTPPFDPTASGPGFVPSRIGLADLIIDTEAELQLGQALRVVYPVAITHDLLSGAGMDLVVAFGETHYPPDHPVLEYVRAIARGQRDRPRVGRAEAHAEGASAPR